MSHAGACRDFCVWLRWDRTRRSSGCSPKAMDMLQSLSTALLLRSSLLQTDPVDCPPGSPPFINAVAGLTPAQWRNSTIFVPSLEGDGNSVSGYQPKKIHNEPRLTRSRFNRAFGRSNHKPAGIDSAASSRAFAPLCIAAVKRNRPRCLFLPGQTKRPRGRREGGGGRRRPGREGGGEVDVIWLR